MMIKFVLRNGLILILLMTGVMPVLSAPPKLPLYEITMDDADLGRLYQNPYSDQYYTAVLTYDSLEYECQVRFRGASARNLPKKSWKIKFEDNDNIFKTRKLNFNSEYRDYSIMRNHLTNTLYDFLGSPASETEYIFLKVNGQRKGVMLKIEELEDDFLDRNKLSFGSIYKARDHGANLAPLTKFSRYFYTWDKELGNSGDYSDLQILLNKIFYFDNKEFEEKIPSIFNLENILNYFAIEFCVVGFDSFTKNYNLYIDSEMKNVMLLPWDNDATFGNNWDGSFRSDFIPNIDGHRPDNQNWESLRFNVLFQRLMEYPQWRTRFQEKVSLIIQDGFQYLSQHIDSVYNEIWRDVHQDPEKRGTNEDFDNEMDRLKYFMTERAIFLQGKNLFQRKKLSDIYCSNAFLSGANPDAFFRVTAEETQEIAVHYSYDFSNSLHSLDLYDDGLHGDFDAGDLVYGNKFTLSSGGNSMIAFSFFSDDEFYHLANGLGYVASNRTHSYALNLENTNVDVASSVQISNVYNWQDNYFVEIQNISGKTIDLSYCHLKGKYDYFDVILREGTKISPASSIIITSNAEMASLYFNNKGIYTQIYFDISIGDTLHLVSPVYNRLTSKICTAFSGLPAQITDVVINEIFYNSSINFGSQDWVELYNPQTTDVNLSNWQFKDSDDNHVFYIPGGTIIKADSFLVLCRDALNFKEYYPDVNNFIGNFNFGLSGSGELIRLFDSALSLVDSIHYNEKEPWPEEADGEGYSIELVDPLLDNAKAESWKSSTNIGGTPGKVNSVFDPSVTFLSDLKKVPGQIELNQNFPNPFNMKTRIEYQVAFAGHISLEIYSLDGRLINTLLKRNSAKGRFFVDWRGDDNSGNSVASGIYIYRFNYGKVSESKKMVLLK